MLTDCESGDINLILTKSMSRFGRNILDTFLLLDRLLKLDIEVRFELEGINNKDKRILESIAGATAHESVKERGELPLYDSLFLCFMMSFRYRL